MKILFVYKSAGWIADHVIPSFSALSSKCVFLDIRGLDLTSSDGAISALLTSEKPNVLFMLEGFDSDISPETLRTARKSGITTINYLVDVPQDWWKSLYTAEHFEFLLCAQFKRSNRLKRSSNTVVGFPFAVSSQFALDASRVYSQFSSRSVSDRALFIGSAHSRWRRTFVNSLIAQGLNLDIVGAGWIPSDIQNNSARWSDRPDKSYRPMHYAERIRGAGMAPLIGAIAHRILPVADLLSEGVAIHGRLETPILQKMAVCAKFHISTSVHGNGYLVGRKERQTKLRDVELLCYGRPYITDAPISDDFSPDKFPILSYNRVEEIPALVASISQDPDKFSASAAAAIDLVKSSHTWTQRFEMLSLVTGLEFK